VVKLYRSHAHGFLLTSRRESSAPERRDPNIDAVLPTEFPNAAVSALTVGEAIAGLPPSRRQLRRGLCPHRPAAQQQTALSSLSSTPQALGPAWPVRYPPTGRVFNFSSSRVFGRGVAVVTSHSCHDANLTRRKELRSSTRCSETLNSRSIGANPIVLFSNGSCWIADKGCNTHPLSVALAGVRQATTRTADTSRGPRYPSDAAATVAAALLVRCPTFARSLRAD